MNLPRRARPTSTQRRRSNQPEADAEQKVGVHYLRVSSVRQTHTALDIDRDGNSIATQREECTAKAAAMGIAVTEEFIEPGKSAQTIDKRPEFRRLLAYLAENPEVGYVFVYSRSRAFRNIEDAVLPRKHLRGLGVKIVSTKEDFGDSLEAEFMETISDTMNDLQNRRNGEDIKVKMAHKARNGGTIGRAPIGYLNVRKDVDGRQVNTVDTDSERAPLIRTLFELYATGDYTLDDLADTAEDMGLRARPFGRWKAERPIAQNTIHRMLGDPYYAGYTVYDGELFDGRHEAIVPGDLFERVQDVLELRSNPAVHDNKLTHYLKGLLFCDRCEKAGRHSRLIYTEANGRNARYGYFKCKKKQTGECDLPHLPVHLVEQKVVDLYGRLALTANYLDEMTDALGAALASQEATERQLAGQLDRELAHLNEQEDRLIDLAQEGTLPRAKIQERLNDIKRQRDSLTTRQSAVHADLAAGAELLRLGIDLCRDPGTLYARAVDNARAQINKAFFTALHVDAYGDIQDAIWTEPFADLRAVHQAWLQCAPLASPAGKPTKAAHTGLSRLELALLAAQADDGPYKRNHRPSVDLAGGSNSLFMVELRGFEPLAFSLRTRRATNCATAPSA
ncbi:recombinase family protein [Nostocoides vanveenii]|uniref:Recombinase family protein n=1 Tax=Nostocoides vanveenii TaxID=330835 RepID=A0ABP4WU33_9MICO